MYILYFVYRNDPPIDAKLQDIFLSLGQSLAPADHLFGLWCPCRTMARRGPPVSVAAKKGGAMAIRAMMISKKNHQKWFDGLMMVNWWVYDGFFIFIWLVVYQNPSEKWWKTSVRQLGWWHSQYDGKVIKKVLNHQPGKNWWKLDLVDEHWICFGESLEISMRIGLRNITRTND